MATKPELPAMLYKPGGELEWDGEMFDTLVVEDDEALEAALGEGWSVGKPGAEAAADEPETEADPLDHDGDGKKGGSKPRAAKKDA